MANDLTLATRGMGSRVLLLPPTRRDAQAIQKVLTAADIDCMVCTDMAQLCQEVSGGAGGVVVSEEAITAEPDNYVACIADQPVWSDLATIILSRWGAEPPVLAQILPKLGNVSVVERPVRITTLLSIIRSSLRGRQRQYQVKAHLAQLQEAQRGLRLNEERKAALLESERAARANAENTGRLKDEFLATLSHELRTPLSAILGWSNILGKLTGGTGQVAHGLQIIERNARAQSQIIEDLLDMSRIISGKVRLNVREMEICPVVQAAVDSVRPAAQAKGVALQIVLDPSAGPIRGDPDRIQQILWNLLTNAVKFTPKNQRIQVLLEKANSHVQVSVIDTGEGIKPEFLPHVFDRFRQADASTTRHHGGLGLGLAIVKQLVEVHGGSIRATSPGVGQGACFVVTLPVVAIHLPEKSQSDPQAPLPAPPQQELDRKDDVSGLKILVVDDEPDSRELVKRVLEDSHALVTIAGSAGEAIKLVPMIRPDVIITDIGMPEEDGFSLIRKVRGLSADQGGMTPAIALTAYASAEDRLRTIRAGFQQHVAKPVEPAELVAIVASFNRLTG